MVHMKVAAQPCDASGVNGSVFEGFPVRETSFGFFVYHPIFGHMRADNSKHSSYTKGQPVKLNC